MDGIIPNLLSVWSMAWSMILCWAPKPESQTKIQNTSYQGQLFLHFTSKKVSYTPKSFLYVLAGIIKYILIYTLW